jgi:DNA-binding NtrC family response regulator
VILDLIMPELSGMDAYNAIRSIDPSLKVLVASGFAQGETIERLLDEGALAILRKPFALSELVEMVATHIRSPSHR